MTISEAEGNATAQWGSRGGCVLRVLEVGQSSTCTETWRGPTSTLESRAGLTDLEAYYGTSRVLSEYLVFGNTIGQPLPYLSGNTTNTYTPSHDSLHCSLSQQRFGTFQKLTFRS